MTIGNKNGELIIALEGRIDTNNAAQTESGIFAAVGNADTADVVIDAEKLEYISSAGLRVLMKLRKELGKPLPVINVSRDVYDIFETTGFTELLDVKKALRKVSLEGCEVIGRGGHGKVYRLDEETIIKVYHDNSPLSLIEKEREYAKNAFVHGVPSAIAYDIAETEEGCGLVFEMAGATTLGNYIMANPDKLYEYAVKFSKLLKTLNTTEADPALYGDIKDIYRGRLNKAAGYFTDEENALLERILDSVPDGSGMIHGDYHTNNVMVQSDGELVLIDMADISRGNAIFDFAGSYLVMNMSGQSGDEMSLKVIGLDREKAKQVWDITLSTYFDTQDPKRLELLGNICGAFSLFRLAATLGMGTERTRANAERITAILREKLFPNTESFCRLFAMPLGL
ncbi:MAG: anti-sigma factor antagonist [Ruminiclostridium sp.]|nr:anti-sigma factor antagonist [Ruminiclostridium sp.]